MTDTFTKLVKDEIKQHLDKTNDTLLSKLVNDKILIKKDLRIKFVKCGLVYDPSSGHHLEYSFKNLNDANITLQELSIFDIAGKLSINTERKRYLVYVTDVKSIMATLRILGANESLKVYKQTVNYNAIVKDTTRKCNFETANIHRSANASLKQIEDIKKLLKKKKLETLDKDLKVVISARLKYPDLNMTELAEKIGNITKNAINHRFMKIRKMIG